MKDLKTVNQEIELTQTIKSIAQTYEEIAVMKIQKIRTSVLTTRDFLKRVSEIYDEVKEAYKNQVLFRLLKMKNKTDIKKSFSTISKNGKSVNVLITSNERLTGDITNKVFTQFLDRVLQSKDDVVIVGKVGRDLFASQNLNRKYDYFDLPEYNATMVVLKPIIAKIIDYETVEVFHGRFINLVNQIQDMSNLTRGYENKEAKTEDELRKSASKYLFEPSIEVILKFFEIQIFGSLFKQSVAEANLANLGSRINAMEQATTNTGEEVKRLVREKIRLEKSLENKKQLQRLAGINLWSK
ncbi:hypothetical protein COV24_00380 [candidate division WWE3 bacterium CG10_big_fil_rev_8_21_14_0_10_32_10]|uniref:ATP synthase gamma chain n=1 Tax=candidate division WWE3 bacterium CG10_big_fil_rev_8_21_14_0_10_32_10 TaxID=1975090 RepID=A0A2H0RCX1_UNCKA|nr:MAG: hypothetical protein COV24_00380 [candidate division WWE3 bacterium CG10_big_fil_rev_8_21_14_0_10_32_10]